MEALCNELDDLAVQVSDTLQQLTEVKQRMHNSMRQGFFNLSKARHSMGSGQVGAVQYDYSQMKAQARILLSEEDIGNYEFQLQHCKDCPRDTGKRSGKSEGGSDLNIEELSSLSIKEEDEEEEDKTQLGQDPLRWFGILVPQALRQSQTDFANALTESSQLASLQSQLLVVKRQYRDLLKKKAELLQDSDKPDASS